MLTKQTKEFTHFINISYYIEKIEQARTLKQIQVTLEELYQNHFNINNLTKNSKDYKIIDVIIKALTNHIKPMKTKYLINNLICTEIFWNLTKINLTWKQIQKSAFVSQFMRFLTCNHSLAHLHLCCKLKIPARFLRETLFNPMPKLVKEFTKPQNTLLGIYKLLKSVTLLGYNKEDMSKEEQQSILRSLAFLIDDNKQQIPMTVFVKFFWMVAKFNFDFKELELIEWKRKTFLNYFLDHITIFFSNQQKQMTIEQAALFLWSMAVIDVPRSHRLYQTFIQNVFEILQTGSITKQIASQILQSRILYQFRLAETRKETLVTYLNRNTYTSKMQKDVEGIVLSLLDKERIKDPTIPPVPDGAREFQIDRGVLVVDFALTADFVIEIDSFYHKDKVAADKLKNRLLKEFNITVIRYQYHGNRDGFQEDIRQKIIMPYLDYHKKKALKKKDEPTLEKKEEVYNDEIFYLAPFGKKSKSYSDEMLALPIAQTYSLINKKISSLSPSDKAPCEESVQLTSSDKLIARVKEDKKSKLPINKQSSSTPGDKKLQSSTPIVGKVGKGLTIFSSTATTEKKSTLTPKGQHYRR